jgi:hypothetical protein
MSDTRAVERAADAGRIPASLARAQKIFGTRCSRCHAAEVVVTDGRASEGWCRTCAPAVAVERRRAQIDDARYRALKRWRERQ